MQGYGGTVVRTLCPCPLRHLFNPRGLALNVPWLRFGIKTCRSRTAAFAQVRAPGKGWTEQAPPLAEPGRCLALSKLGPRECCIRFDHHLEEREASGLDISARRDKITNVRACSYLWRLHYPKVVIGKLFHKTSKHQ